MSLPRFRSSCFFLALLLAVFFVSGCSKPGQYITQTNQFAVATSNVADAMTIYFSEVLESHIALEMNGYLYMATPIDLKIYDQHGYDIDAINLRRNALEALQNYAKALASTSEVDYGELFYAEAKDVVASIDSLKNKVKVLESSSEVALVYAGVKNLFLGLSKLVALKMSHDQAEDIREAILADAESARELANMVANDIRQNIIPDLIFKQKISMMNSFDHANQHIEGSTLKKRKEYTSDMLVLVENVSESENASYLFVASMDNYNKAVDALVAHAKGGNEADLKSIATTVAIFADQAKRLLELVKM